uniref:Transmembrane protein n=1 Tax=Chromera velia CCMP2878 TaxID=1169474 RepID=A0A0K6S784_9ALVE|eukprot:Cvel_20900.t1-p1 / transcript=Cvel_20900.t1 / gene=Cvel_20900 / organism=Chromera_velia_CCMP2878 / gene_product=hypothetical protein / transcript_product=hypothetical protein / location=Cvel_scaffold1917:8872-15473(-) / protein_length=1284 / sequence_SO=supercontig / SO=protein_coding / is_pseudo=false
MRRSLSDPRVYPEGVNPTHFCSQPLRRRSFLRLRGLKAGETEQYANNSGQLCDAQGTEIDREWISALKQTANAEQGEVSTPSLGLLALRKREDNRRRRDLACVDGGSEPPEEGDRSLEFGPRRTEDFDVPSPGGQSQDKGGSEPSREAIEEGERSAASQKAKAEAQMEQSKSNKQQEEASALRLYTRLALVPSEPADFVEHCPTHVRTAILGIFASEGWLHVERQFEFARRIQIEKTKPREKKQGKKGKETERHTNANRPSDAVSERGQQGSSPSSTSTGENSVFFAYFFFGMDTGPELSHAQKMLKPIIKWLFGLLDKLAEVLRLPVEESTGPFKTAVRRMVKRKFTQEKLLKKVKGKMLQPKEKKVKTETAQAICVPGRSDRPVLPEPDQTLLQESRGHERNSPNSLASVQEDEKENLVTQEDTAQTKKETETDQNAVPPTESTKEGRRSRSHSRSRKADRNKSETVPSSTWGWDFLLSSVFGSEQLSVDAPMNHPNSEKLREKKCSGKAEGKTSETQSKEANAQPESSDLATASRALSEAELDADDEEDQQTANQRTVQGGGATASRATSIAAGAVSLHHSGLQTMPMQHPPNEQEESSPKSPIGGEETPTEIQVNLLHSVVLDSVKESANSLASSSSANTDAYIPSAPPPPPPQGSLCSHPSAPLPSASKEAADEGTDLPLLSAERHWLVIDAFCAEEVFVQRVARLFAEERKRVLEMSREEREQTTFWGARPSPPIPQRGSHEDSSNSAVQRGRGDEEDELSSDREKELLAVRRRRKRREWLGLKAFFYDALDTTQAAVGIKTGSAVRRRTRPSSPSSRTSGAETARAEVGRSKETYSIAVAKEQTRRSSEGAVTSIDALRLEEELALRPRRPSLSERRRNSQRLSNLQTTRGPFPFSSISHEHPCTDSGTTQRRWSLMSLALPALMPASPSYVAPKPDTATKEDPSTSSGTPQKGNSSTIVPENQKAVAKDEESVSPAHATQTQPGSLPVAAEDPYWDLKGALDTDRSVVAGSAETPEERLMRMMMMQTRSDSLVEGKSTNQSGAVEGRTLSEGEPATDLDIPGSQEVPDTRHVFVKELLVIAVAAGGFDARTQEILEKTAERFEMNRILLKRLECELGAALLVGLLKGDAGESASYKWTRYLTVFSAAVGGGALVALTGGLATPAVLAAVSAGWGALHLGSMGAAGAFLMSSGGTALITSLFGAGGASLAGLKMSHRMAKIEEFSFKNIGGRMGALSVSIGISGILRSKRDVKRPWVPIIRGIMLGDVVETKRETDV